MKRVLIADANNAFRQGLAALLEEQASLKAVAQAASLAEARHVLPDVDHNVELAIVGLDLYDVDATLLIEDPQESRVSAQREVDLEPIHMPRGCLRSPQCAAKAFPWRHARAS